MRYSKNMMPAGGIAPYPRAPEQDCMANTQDGCRRDVAGYY
ncbi:hypothetical protein NEILACOT_05161 [Neisseria lactamica ATCC 23970]|uniref:Uncharacterized protein n=1 Tax=Neisseria lactamica ATCC 23970 TaxID=546265 RepID=D0WC81_NEILA|nr:hypothetical protein NEILACOT_05161 [Neisseria lactamica ATCC 23970]